MKLLNFKNAAKDFVNNIFKASKKEKQTIAQTPQIDNDRFKRKSRGENFTHKLIGKKKSNS